MAKGFFALIDCNNFYVSCERAFNPRLEKKPVCILSNNDGCIVSRSNEAKALGIPMGAPYFKHKATIEMHRGVTLSSNYTLYASMSERIMNIVRKFCTHVEVYSIDEAFLFFEEFSPDALAEYCLEIKKTLFQWTGIPVSIGIGASKTLAKIASNEAKKHPAIGVFSLTEEKHIDEVLARYPLQDIWMIGRGSSEHLNQIGIYTGKELRDAEPKIVRKQLSVNMEKTLYELRGIPCFKFDETSSNRKNIISSRSFGRPVTDLESLEEAISSYAARACEKMREQKSCVQGINVFLKTNRFSPNSPYVSENMTKSFAIPTNDTRIIIRLAKDCIKKLYKKGFSYKKAGITLLDLLPDSHQQGDLFESPASPKTSQLMNLLDGINEHMGKGTLFLAAEGIQQNWKMKSTNRSPCYTTRWDELMLVKS